MLTVDQGRRNEGIVFRLFESVSVEGTEWFTGGQGRLGLTGLISSARFVPPLDPRETNWTLGGHLPGSPGRSAVELNSVMRERVLPYLEQFASTTDVLAYAEDTPGNPLGDDFIPAVEALTAWRLAGAPVTGVTVSMIGPTRARVEVDGASSFAGSDEDLAMVCVELGTPARLAWAVTDIERVSSRVLIVHGHGLDAALLQSAYQNYLSVIRYASRVPNIVPPVPRAMPSLSFFSRATEVGTQIPREPLIDVEAIHDNIVRVNFRDDVAHEYSDAIDACAALCLSLEWVASVNRLDREVLTLNVVRHTQTDLRQLRAALIATLKGSMRQSRE